MNNSVKTANPQEKRAERHAFGELLKRGVLPYRAVDGSLRATTPMGCRLELRAVPSTGNGAVDGRRFAVAGFQPRPELFFLCVEFDRDEIAGMWVLPSTAFFAYSDADEAGGLRELNLDAKQEHCLSRPFREYNSFFQNRWEPIIQFDYFRRFMPPMDAPGFQYAWEDMEDILAMMEISESREWPPARVYPLTLPKMANLPVVAVIKSDSPATKSGNRWKVFRRMTMLKSKRRFCL